MKILICFGTRPEWLKIKPIIEKLNKDNFDIFFTGQHDDLIMALAMAVYVAETSFTQLNKVNEMAKSMLESWTVETYEKPTQQFFNPQIPNQMFDNNPAYRNQPTKRDYQEYLWVFGGIKR